ncbi:MAG: PVC-type heme-binding CxxCH protein [bacterium]|nr:glucose dehydrogenase [Planctomycetota bacterium]HIL52286.1 glucose dehydrogenase [Planctomycetota bacterium]
MLLLTSALACSVAAIPQTDAAASQETEATYQPQVVEASEEGREAMARFSVPEGFVVELFAAEPLLANPVAFHAANNGDFYVAETFRLHKGVTDIREHLDWLEDDMACQTVADRVAMFAKWDGDQLDELYGVEHDRIKLLRDTDGDGLADWSAVYADGFSNYATGIGSGVLEFGGDVYFACVPDLWKLRDTDGDGRADQREALSSGYGVRVTLLGHDLHGLQVGSDGKLYFSCGDRGFTVETPDGTILHPDTGAVLRCNLDGSDLEVFHTGLRNPQELAFDKYGNLFSGDNNSDGGDQARWVQIVEGADSGWRSSYQWIEEPVLRGPWNDELLWKPHFEGQAAYILPPIANLGNGPSGLCYNPGSGLPPGYDDYFFLADFRGDANYSGIHAFALASRGASFDLLTPGRLIWSTLVTDVDFGPDGAIYFSDWVFGWNMTGKGRIYRASHPEFTGKGVSRGVAQMLKTGLEETTTVGLLQLLAHVDMRIRQMAQFALVARGEDGQQALLTGLEQGGSEMSRLHCIWGVGMAAREEPALLEKLHPYLKDPAAEVRAQVARVLGDARYRAASGNLTRALADPSARVRMYAAIACARIADERATEALFALARGAADDDTVLRSVAIYGLERCASAEVLGAATRSSNIYARLAATVALRRQGSPEAARFLFDPDPLVVVEAARAIHDVPIEAAFPALADALERVTKDDSAALVRRVLNANLRLGGAQRSAALAAFAADGEQQTVFRADALRLLGQWAAPKQRDDVVSNWRPIAARSDEGLAAITTGLLGYGVLDAPASVLERWIDLTVIYSVMDTGGALIQIAQDRTRRGQTRRKALEALEQLSSPGHEAVLRASLFDPDAKVRAAALEALPRIDPEEALPLFKAVLESGQLAERRAVYAALARIDGFEADALFRAEFGKIRMRVLPAELQLDMLEAMYSRPSQNLKLLVEKLRQERLDFDPQLGAWQDCFFGGDAEEGERIFRAKAETTCLRCHALDETQGTAVGPALQGVGARLTRRQLCQSIVAPNARISPGYETVLLVLDDESVLVGRVTDEGSEFITLLMSDGATEEIAVATIIERRPDLSAMPDGLGQFLNHREMRDVIAFLAQL